MRFITILALITSYAFAHTSNSQHTFDINQGLNKEKVIYASIYTDQLISEFDQLLNSKIHLLDHESILYSDVYAKLQSARSYLEQFEGHNEVISMHEKSLKSLKNHVRNPKLYLEVIQIINKKAIPIIKEHERNKHAEKSKSLIYPSATSAGNVTGNTFPHKTWSLTFDDGPRNRNTAKIVENLYQRNIRATFFMLTKEAKKYLDEANNVVNSQMDVALHSYTHANLDKASSDALIYEITQAKKDLESLLNVKTHVFRLPYGAGLRNNTVRNLIAQNKYIHIFWNIDTLDWKDKNPQSVLARVKKQMQLTPNNSGVILFHDIHAATVIASELTMDYLLDNGHKICTVEEVISHLNGFVQDCLK